MKYDLGKEGRLSLNVRQTFHIIFICSCLYMFQEFHEYYNNSKTLMDSISENYEAKRKYSKISVQKRVKLIKLIIEKDYSIAKASRRLCIKASTARMIFNRYKETSEFCTKNGRVKTLINIEKPRFRSFEVVQPFSAEKELIVDQQEKSQVIQNAAKPNEDNYVPKDTNTCWAYVWAYPEYPMTPYFFF